MRQSCLQYAQPAASHPFWPGWTLVTTQVRGICAHPLCQQSDLLSALPTTPIRIERILAVRSGAANEWKKGVLAAGSGCDFRCGRECSHSCCLQPRCVPALSHFFDPALVRPTSGPRGIHQRYQKQSSFLDSTQQGQRPHGDWMDVLTLTLSRRQTESPELMDTYLPSMGMLNDGLRSPSLSLFPANMSVRDVDFAFRGLSARDAYSGRDTKIPFRVA